MHQKPSGGRAGLKRSPDHLAVLGFGPPGREGKRGMGKGGKGKGRDRREEKGKGGERREEGKGGNWRGGRVGKGSRIIRPLYVLLTRCTDADTSTV